MSLTERYNMDMVDIGVILPDEFLDRLRVLLPQSRCSSVLTAFEKRKPTTFRINTLKSTAEKVSNSLRDQGYELGVVPWNTNAFVLRNNSLRILSQTSEYTQGEIYVQNLSSMLPAMVLDPKPGERILDIAAAPGSKTTQIASLMQNRGEIVANDTSQTRIYRLKANMVLQGASIAHISRDDGRAIWKRFPEYFDRALVDVPCSMEGRFFIEDPKSYTDWSVKKVKDLSHLQRWLLRSAISATKPGGIIVYSTCTLSPEENEEVIDWVLEKERGNVELETVHTAPLPFETPVLSWRDKTFDAQITKTGRIFPTDLMEGFYVAKLKKIRTSVPKALAV